MENENTILDENILEVDTTIEPLHIISLPKFIIFSIISFGIYTTWWQYKVWRYYKQKEKADILPVARAIFSIFFVYSLFNKIQDSANEKGYTDAYSSGALFAGVLISGGLSRLPKSFGLISIFSFMFFIPPFKAFNYFLQNSTDLNVIEQDSLNSRQIALVIFGLLFWALVILGLTVSDSAAD